MVSCHLIERTLTISCRRGFRINHLFKDMFKSIKSWVINLGRILQTGLLNFMRNIGIAVAAMAVMVVTLTVLLLSIVVNSTFSNTIAQITSKIDISVYLKDSDS